MRDGSHLSAATFAYPEVEAATRAILAKSRKRIEPDGSVFVFETCLRTEVVVAGGKDRLDEALGAAFGGITEVRTARVRTDLDAVEHLYRVAAGLESPVRGEGEVLTQFRQAVGRALERGEIAGIFARLLESGVAVGRQARESIPDRPYDSLAAVAAQVVGGEERVAVLGSGVMATAVVRALHSLPAPPPVTVVARSPERVWLDAVDVWGFDQALPALESFPAVVSATSAKHRLVDSTELADAVARRASHLTLVDMAMPPDFQPAPHEMVRYVGIDDLARLAERRPPSDQVDPLVRAGAVDAYRAYSNHHQLGPVIGGLTKRAEGIVEDAVARFGGRLRSEEDLAVLRQTAHTVARALIARPISYVKQADLAPEVVDIVADAFGVDE
jgi:glutamyl-tRNA reductase